ncbi:MAG: lysophospholipase [Candidatus Hydrogenedentes bacterium]|nr:lysophospholipase [Candidatus Hydrogenedentota bacterium]
MSDKIPGSGHFTSRDGLQFFERRWLPEGPVAGHVALIHGYGEHCSRYEHVAHAMNAGGFAVHTYDQRGFGRSPGRRGYINSFAQLVDDADDFIKAVRPRVGKQPFFIFGHSMGGLVLANYYVRYRPPVSGLIFSGPFLAVGSQVSPVLVAMAGVMGRLTPWLPVLDLELQAISRIKEVVDRALSDPMSYHGKIHARTGAQMQLAIQQVQPKLATIEVPLYIMHGTADRLTPLEGSEILHAQAASTDKTLRIYEGGYHELFNDLDSDKVLGDIVGWLKVRAGG